MTTAIVMLNCVSRCLDEELISAVMGDTCGRGYFLTHGCPVTLRAAVACLLSGLVLGETTS